MESTIAPASVGSMEENTVPQVLHLRTNSLPSTEPNDVAQLPTAAADQEVLIQPPHQCTTVIDAPNMSRDPSANLTEISSASTEVASPANVPEDEEVLQKDYSMENLLASYKKSTKEVDFDHRENMEYTALLKEPSESLVKATQVLIWMVVARDRNHDKATSQFGVDIHEEKTKAETIIKSLEQQLRNREREPKNADEIARKRLEAEYQVKLQKAANDAKDERTVMRKKILNLGDAFENLRVTHVDYKKGKDEREAEKDAKCQGLQRQLNAAHDLADYRLKELEIAESMRVDLTIRATTISLDNVNLKEEKDKLASQNKASESGLAEFEAKCTELTAENEKLASEKKTSASRLAESEAKCTKLTMENRNQKAKIEKFASENQTLSSEKVILKEKNAKLLDESRKSAELESEAASWRAKYAELDKQRQRERSREAQTEAKVKISQESMKKQEAKLNGNIQAGENRISELELELSEMTKGHASELSELKGIIKANENRAQMHLQIAGGFIAILAVLVAVLLASL